MGKEIWLSMHRKNLGSGKIVRTSILTSPLHVSRSEILPVKYPHVSAVNHIATRTFRDKKYNINKADSFFRLILMFTLTWITEREQQREIKNKGDQFHWKNDMKI